MNNGRFVSVIISFIVIYCVAVLPLSMCVCVWTLFFIAFVRSLSPVFRPLRTHSHQSCAVFAYYPILLPSFTIVLLWPCFADRTLTCEESGKNERTHTSPTKTRVCACVHRSSVFSSTLWIFGGILSRFCRIFGQATWGRNWIKIVENAFVSVYRKEVNCYLSPWLRRMCDSVAAAATQIICFIPFEWLSILQNRIPHLDSPLEQARARDFFGS